MALRPCLFVTALSISASRAIELLIPEACSIEEATSTADWGHGPMTTVSLCLVDTDVVKQRSQIPLE